MIKLNINSKACFLVDWKNSQLWIIVPQLATFNHSESMRRLKRQICKSVVSPCGII